jgi:hypothetical protein
LQEVFTLISEAHAFVSKHLQDKLDKPCTELNPFCPPPPSDPAAGDGGGRRRGRGARPVTMQCGAGGDPCSVHEDDHAPVVLVGGGGGKRQVLHHPADRFEDEDAMYRFYATHKH